jgi:radical SAM superfamily enzyme YgiQ (UPF0313 family)
MPHYLGPSGLLSINTARGCPYRCTFCYNTAIYRGFNRYRTRSIEGVLAEVDHLVSRYRPRALLFMDDDFLANQKRGTELLTVLHERFPQLRYRIDARADELSDAAAVAHLAAQGVESVFFGVEGVSGEFLRRIRKGQDTHTTFEAAAACAANRITATYSFTCGYPDETYRDLYDRVDMASALTALHPRSRCQIEIVSPVIGTPLYAELERNQLVPAKSPEAWAYFSDWKSAAAKVWIADAQFYEAFQLAFYLAFSVRAELDGGPRLISNLLSRWSRVRLAGRRPIKLPEYRAGNYLLKKVIWGRSP